MVKAGRTLTPFRPPTIDIDGFCRVTAPGQLPDAGDSGAPEGAEPGGGPSVGAPLGG